jgi:hypothetical protein
MEANEEVALRLDYPALAFASKPRIENCAPSYGERYLA